MYCPVDRPPTEIDYGFASLAEIDQIVAYTNFGKRIIEQEIADYNGERVGSSSDIRIIPHGVDTEKFFPLCGFSKASSFQQSRQAAREILFPERKELLDAFIVLNANRNFQRKRIDLTLQAFADFVVDKPEQVYLYLHMGMEDLGIDILQTARQLGIEKRLLVTTREKEKPNISDAELNIIYNACDVGVNTATGEGWGLVAFEHGATGGAQILPDHSACAELWKDKGLLIPVGDKMQGEVLSADVTAALQQLYYDRKLLDELSKKAYQYVTSSAFSWEEIASQWNDLFVKMLNK